MKDHNNNTKAKAHSLNTSTCPDCWGYSEYNDQIQSRSFLESKSKIGWIAQYAIDKLGVYKCPTNIDC